MTLPSIATNTSMVNVFSWIECAQWMGLGYHSETTQKTTISTTTTTKTKWPCQSPRTINPFRQVPADWRLRFKHAKRPWHWTLTLITTITFFLQILQGTTTTATRTVIKKDKWASKLSGQVKVDLWRSAATQTNSCWTLRQIRLQIFTGNRTQKLWKTKSWGVMYT